MQKKHLVIWAIVIIVAAPFVIFVTPQLMGLQAYVVTSGSMSPHIPKGSVIYVESVPPSQLEVGDVITFAPNTSNIPAKRVVHRIVGIRETNYTRDFKTKGDANAEADPGWTQSYRVLGKEVFSIPMLGSIVSDAHTLPAVIILVMLPAIFLMRNEIDTLLDNYLTEDSQEEEERPKSYVLE